MSTWPQARGVVLATRMGVLLHFSGQADCALWRQPNIFAVHIDSLDVVVIFFTRVVRFRFFVVVRRDVAMRLYGFTRCTVYLVAMTLWHLLPVGARGSTVSLNVTTLASYSCVAFRRPPLPCMLSRLFIDWYLCENGAAELAAFLTSTFPGTGTIFSRTLLGLVPLRFGVFQGDELQNCCVRGPTHSEHERSTQSLLIG